ncbi:MULTISPECIES: AbrB/MazE/SpoVT family DNA-binding domain-containing protein [Ornithinibacillus]|jgi:bifunctional DNA-binding transcriptional regulator/antitoxin component of YhaV-PrlF toxin-antitoxin module|uniref:AbrB/MazE/SpoVT family DNA-binding domain-containing protein n=1 Tax=Ornithinibacillus TaxID=484508 RepID=UPI00064DC9B9|nr:MULTISPECIES: hypothetical protein [Ornithinibacillus]
MFNIVIFQDIQIQLIDTGLYCILNKHQSITIPKTVRKALALLAGDEVTVSMTSTSRGLIIQKLTNETLENIMIITRKGAIRIPVELKKNLCLEKGDMFQVYKSIDNQFVVLECKSQS